MLRARWWLVLCLHLSLALLWTPRNTSGETIQCTTGDSITATVSRGRFHVYRPGQQGLDIKWRDLEFMWDASYSGGLSLDAQNTLRGMASTLVDSTGRNPFGASVAKINLNYNYFSLRGPTYNTTNPYDSTSMALERATAGYNNIDKSHVDWYLKIGAWGQWPSAFIEAAEDSTTGHAVDLANPSLTDVKPNNSIMTGGPGPGFHIDLDGDGWTHPDSGHVQGFSHEFEHSFNPLGGASTMDEMFAAAAEAVGGRLGRNTEFEVPYTWPLLYTHFLNCSSSPNCCENPRDAIQSNYFGRGLFTAYLAYNFRGADTTGSAAGLNDDFLRRWSRNTVSLEPEGYPAGIVTRHWSKLVGLMGDDSCGTCLGKAYFHPGDAPLPNYDRAQLLLHNWRVANYVNRSDLPATEGQYGFPPQFGFSPGQTIKAWQAFDGCGGSDDLVAVPPVVTLTSAHVSQEMILRVKREFRGNWHPMRLKPTGAEYWVVRADTASLGTTPHDLVITVSSDSIFRNRAGPAPYHQFDGRLIASVIGYTLRAPDPVESPQWANPQWAQLALEPMWVDVDSLPAELVFTVPSFGLTYKAAVVVISLADGPGRALEATNLGWFGVGNQFRLPYRVGLALRAPSDSLPNPRGLQQDSSVVADCPAWSPASDEVAFTRYVPSTGVSRIYRQKLDGSPASPLLSGSEVQSSPDWSLRGDWVAFAQDSGTAGNQRDIWLYSTVTGGSAQRLTNQRGLALRPAFQPNGQRIAYAYFPIIHGGIQDRWELRWVDITGANDVALLAPGDASEIKSVRWSPDGGHVYFTRNDSLYAVAISNGTVAAHPEILAKVTSFDFHLSGTNRLAAEETGNAGTINVPQFSPVAFRRLVLRDVAATDTRARFYRTAAEFYSPRWSPDGLRVAYSSNQNSANVSSDRDLFVGQVSYNQPPQFQGLGDVVVQPGQNFQMTILATDPNGEALTYEMPALYLPPGASFNPSTRDFTWPNPGPQGGNHYVVVRAFDSSGGVANKVVRLMVALNPVSDLGPGELMSDTQVMLAWTAPGQGTAQGVEYDLRYANYAITENNFYLSTRWTVPAPGVPGASELATVTGLSPCTQYWFALKTKDSDANWTLLSNVFSATTLCGGGGGEYRARERGPVVAGRRLDGSGSSISALAVEMGVDEGAPTWTLRELDEEEAAGLAAGDSVAVLLQARDESGAWSDRMAIKTSEAEWRYGVHAFRKPGRIVFFGSYGARQAWSPVEMRAGAVAGLVSAQHSRLGSLAGSFNDSGSTSLDLGAGDTLILAYALGASAGPVFPGLFLLVGPPGSEVAAAAFARPETPAATQALPTAFALRQNQPNPFSGSTTIRFELPAEATVRFDIFDAQGRLVRTLANRQFPGGVHAVEWDHRTDAGQPLGAGVYLYRIQAGHFRDQKKMVLLAR